MSDPYHLAALLGALIVGYLLGHATSNIRGAVSEVRVRAIERDVKKLMRHFACGQGYVGCNGGPKCEWEHK